MGVGCWDIEPVLMKKLASELCPDNDMSSSEVAVITGPSVFMSCFNENTGAPC